MSKKKWRRGIGGGYFDANPRARERIPRAEALVGHLTPGQAAQAVLAGIGRGRDVCAQWRWALLAPFARAVPGPSAWLYARTGATRPG